MFFVTSLAWPAPVSVSWCDRVINITRMDAASAFVGLSPGYSGDTTQQQAPVLTGWPCSQLILSSGASTRKTGMDLPSDAGFPLAAFFLPATAPLPEFNDVITDDLGRRWYVQMVESSPLGYRLTSVQVAI